MEHKMRFF